MDLAKGVLGHLELLNKVGDRHLSHHLLRVGTALREHENMAYGIAREHECITALTPN